MFEAYYHHSFQARLEDLAEKDAREKSDAAREAFLAELALDSKKGATAGVDNSKHERLKDKKKSKEGRKNKDSKVWTLLSNSVVGVYKSQVQTMGC